MKKLRVIYLVYIAAIALSLVGSYANAQEASNGKVLITGSRFTYPLVEKWISEFKKQYPNVPVRILPRGSASADSGNLIINAHKLQKEEIKTNYTVINIGRYAILPVANAKNQLYVNDYSKNGISPKEIKALYFQEYDAFESTEEKKDKKKKDVHEPLLYTREQKACAPTAFSNFYGLKQENLKGKGILGDDKHLINAIKQDTNGITYNVLGYIYNTNTRKVNDGIAVLPIDQNNNNKLDENENIFADLDNVISKIETGDQKQIPTDFVNISYPTQFDESTNNLKLFVQYILTEGQKFNHQFGFLDFAPESLAKQRELAEASFQARNK